MRTRTLTAYLKLFFLRVKSEETSVPLQDTVRVIALYAVSAVFLFSSAYNLPLVIREGMPLSASLLIAYPVLVIASLVTFWSTRSIKRSRIPMGIAVILVIAQQYFDIGGVYGLGLLTFFFCIPIMYLFFGIFPGITFIVAYYLVILERLTFGSANATSIYNNPIISQRLSVILGIATVVGIVACACMEQIIRNLSLVAFHDTTTRLPNRFSIEQKLKRSMRCGPGKKFSVIGIRILNYNRVNAMLGTDQGDNLMLQIAQRLREIGKDERFVGRWSGSLFMTKQDTVDHARLVATADEILDALSAPYQLESHRITVLFSVAISRYPYDALSSRQLMSNIISLLDHNRPRDVLFFNNENLREQHYHFNLVELLNKANPDTDFRLVYQPKIRVGDGKCVGAEVLLRWKESSLGEIAPGVFIPIAEESGQIRTITRWVIKRCFADLSETMEEAADGLMGDPAVSFAINLSVMDLRDRDFTAFLKRELSVSRIPAAHVEFEITEGTMIDDDPQIRKTIQAILDLGFRISIDDFGTGYSSLSYLHKIHVHALKIDQSFVRGIDAGKERDTFPVIDAIISMGKSLGLDVIAEGVESERQLGYLRERGCDTAQGWLFSKAIPFTDYLGFASRAVGEDDHSTLAAVQVAGQTRAGARDLA
jgi:diguanylate cyclase (GGDEF)-like protein